MIKKPVTLHLLPFFLCVFVFATSPLAALADEGLPDGPIHDRHELMEDVGKQAKIIGDALKTDDLSPVAGAAKEIAELAGKTAALFPEGSTHPKSRAMSEIWANWAEFDKLCNEMQTTALALEKAAGGDVKAAAGAMFASCKSCHDQFRAPDDH